MGFDHKNSTGLKETEAPLLEGACKVSCIPGCREKSSYLIRDWARQLLILENLTERLWVAVSPYRDNTCIIGVLEGEEKEKRPQKYFKR